MVDAEVDTSEHDWLKANREAEIEEAIDKLKLPQLFQVVSSCHSTLGRLVPRKYLPMSPGEVRELFGRLRSALPVLEAVADFDVVTRVATAALTGANAEKHVERLEKLTSRDFLNSLIPSPVKPIKTWIKGLCDEAEHRIEREQWDGLAKAEAYLENYICGGGLRLESCSDQEALVYLRSRGKECSDAMAEVDGDWWSAADRTIEQCALRFNHEARDVVRWSRNELPNFWRTYGEKEEATIDATMLRTAEWCEIWGFDEWWQRWAREIIENAVRREIASSPMTAIWVFGVCRSDLAIALLGDTLELYVWALSHGHPDKETPWRLNWRESDWRRVRQNTTIPAALLFGMRRIGLKDLDPKFIDRAADFLIAAQKPSGAWSTWTDCPAGSVEATAMAIHGLSLYQPRGWRGVAAKGAEWLWNEQDRFGFWADVGDELRTTFHRSCARRSGASWRGFKGHFQAEGEPWRGCRRARCVGRRTGPGDQIGRRGCRGRKATGRAEKVWTRNHCPSCGDGGIEFVSASEFSRRCEGRPTRGTVGSRINTGKYWTDGLGKVPWCKRCKERTPLGRGVEQPVEKPHVDDWKPTDEEEKTVAAWAVNVAKERFEGFVIEHCKMATPPSPAAVEVFNVVSLAILEEMKKRAGDLGFDQAKEVGRHAMQDFLNEDHKSRVHRSQADPDRSNRFDKDAD